ncbi:hypothetical protein JTB14_014777 [Gonioctena quinquepunctata]|nr:hypothetical protein JTB14_014777 [Gonioctena quinquepunctata]
MNNIRRPDALRSVVENARQISPKAVTSTKLRKYTATVCQVFNLQERVIDWLTRHMGHDVRVHRDFHRQHESAVELTKIRSDSDFHFLTIIVLGKPTKKNRRGEDLGVGRKNLQ